MKATNSTSAAEMIQQILIQAPQRIPGLRVWRQNTGAVKTDDRFIRYGIPGQPDIQGIMPVKGYGIWLGIEVKAVRDKMTQQQFHFQRMITEAGGIYLECRDVELTLKTLEEICRR